MMKMKYSKRVLPPQLKKTVCVILPRVDVDEFLRERRRRSLSSAPPATLDGPPTKQVNGRAKRRLRIKNEPPCQFHSEADINNDSIEEVCGVLSEPRNAAPCVHDITRTMCYMCSPVPEDKAEIWNEIPRWHTPANPTRTWHTPTVASNSTNTASAIVEPVPTNEQVEPAVVNPPIGVNVGCGTEEQSFIARNSSPVDQSTQTARHYPCKYCPALFSDHMHLMHHKTVHQKMLECVFCSAHFVTKNDLKSHMKLHMMPKHFECVYCTQIFRKKHDIKMHLALHAEQKLFHCLSCPAIFTQKNLLRHHEKSHSHSKFVHFFKRINDETVVESISSDLTNESSISSDSANVSVQSAPSAQVPSMKPNANISNSESIHQEKIQEEPSILEPRERFVNAGQSTAVLNFFNCETCPLSFKSLPAYKTHRKCHTRKDGNFVCTYCKGRFTRKSGLMKHTTASHM